MAQSKILGRIKKTFKTVSPNQDKANKNDLFSIETRQLLPLSLVRTREIIMRDIRPVLKQYDLTEQQWRFLRVVAEWQQADASLIAEKACLLSPSVTRIIRDLAKREYITSHADKNDKRRLSIALTAQGKQLMSEAVLEVNQKFDDLRQIVGDEKWAHLLATLNEFRDIINQAKARDNASDDTTDDATEPKQAD